MRPLLDRVKSVKQINLRVPRLFAPRDTARALPACFLAALVIAGLLVSPALGTGLSGPARPTANSYAGPTLRVSTQPAGGVSKNSATLNGFLESLGPYIEVYVGFEYVLNAGVVSDNIVTIKTGLTKMTAPGAFSASASGLATYTPYQFRAVAESPEEGGQKALGGYRAFHTLVDETPTPVTFTASYVSDITPGTAVLYGYLDSMQSYNEVRVWFNWGASGGFGNTAGEQVLFEPGPFSVKISGLIPNTRYYFRACALPTIGGIATAYSTTDTFTTLGAGELVVGTWPGSNVTASSATVTGFLESMGAYTSANVWFEWGTTESYGYSTPMQTMNQTGIYTWRLQGLQDGTTYHFRAAAIPGSLGWVTARGPGRKFTTVSLPGIVVNTEPASNVTANSAVLNGYITSLGPSGTISAWFDYGTDSTFGNNTQKQFLTKPGNFTYMVTGLEPGTTYYFRVAASTDGRSASGVYSTFSTKAASVLSVSTRAAASIGASSAELHAFVNSTGSAPAIKAWFNYGPGPECGMSTPLLTFASAGPFSAPLSGLVADTTYYYQAVVQSPDGNKAYGKESTFKTASMPRTTVSTLPATGVTDSSATLNGNLDNLGNSASVQAWFEYGTTAEFGNATMVKTLTQPEPFSNVIPVLPGATYFYRAVALNPMPGGGTLSGTTISFASATLPSPPVVSPVTSPYDWFIYLQRFISIEATRILKSLNINTN